MGAASIVVSGWLIDGVERVNGSQRAAAERSDLGDYFGAASAVFSGLALLLLVTTLLFQQRELQLQRKELSLQRDELAASRAELRRSAAADMRSLHVQLTHMSMDDPSLAEVWNDYPGQSHSVIRQHLFANLTFSHYVLVYGWGGITEAELLIHARSLVQSPAFRRYWSASRAAKASLPPDSDEARLFRIFERAINEATTGGTPPP
ncbi:DUF6082 family protein [Streptomyces sp. CA-288835]|uniref:DUF6082 family protein n=1 Tax=Streptomyces sp. CA-288835 TaxID=3240069 RepID=UPI003D91F22C